MRIGIPKEIKKDTGKVATGMSVIITKQNPECKWL